MMSWAFASVVMIINVVVSGIVQPIIPLISVVVVIMKRRNRMTFACGQLVA